MTAFSCLRTGAGSGAKPKIATTAVGSKEATKPKKSSVIKSGSCLKSSSCPKAATSKPSQEYEISEKARKVWLNNHVSWQKTMSWLVSDDGKDGLFEIKCAVCAASKQSNEFAKGVRSIPLLGNLRRHDKSYQHKDAMAKCGLGNEPDLKAPDAKSFHQCLTALSTNPKLSFRASGHRSHEVKLRECLSSAMFHRDKTFLAGAASIALHQDVKQHVLFIRFKACRMDLEVHSGLLGAASLGTSSGATALVDTVSKILDSFCGEDTALLQHIRHHIELLNADAASDEQLSLRLLCQRLLPNVLARTRDRTHAARRILSRPWQADVVISKALETNIHGGQSMVSLIQNSPHFQEVFKGYCQKIEANPVCCERIKNLSCRKHRFDSLQRPLSRLCLCFDAIVSTAIWITIHRKGQSQAEAAATFLDGLDHESLLLLAACADCSDEAMTLIRFLDSEEHDLAHVQLECQSMLSRLHWLIIERNLQRCGYTHHMAEQLKRARGFLVRGKPKSIGGLSNPAPLLDKVFQRMASWLHLATQTVHSEFPSFELLSSFMMFDVQAPESEAWFCLAFAFSIFLFLFDFCARNIHTPLYTSL